MDMYYAGQLGDIPASLAQWQTVTGQAVTPTQTFLSQTHPVKGKGQATSLNSYTLTTTSALH